MAKQPLTERQAESPGKQAQPKRDGRRSEATRLLVLDTAERLFSLQGYEATGMRQIAEEAGVNLGSIHYHWGSKEALCREALERRLLPILEQRLAAINLVESSDGSLAQLLDASHRPSLLAGGAAPEQAAVFRRFYGRMLFDPSQEVQQILASLLDTFAEHFVGMLKERSGKLSDHEFYWRITFLYGAFLYAHTAHTRTIELWGDRFDQSNFEDAARFLTRFLEGGLRAPAASQAWADEPVRRPSPRTRKRVAPLAPLKKA